MLSGDNMGDLGESKGVGLWRLDRLFSICGAVDILGLIRA